MHLRLPPIALSVIAAATVESTPPERAHTAFAPPVFSLISATLSDIKSSSFQSPLTPAISNKKLFNILVPHSVWTTSG
jgi:hypothetical protein